MKLLDIFNDAFEQLPKNGDIRKFLHEQKLKMGGEDFCQVFFQWFGGRGGNQYLDYGALALKFHNLFKSKYSNFKYGVKNGNIDTYADKEIIDHLLFDDRHDLYQNVPYYLEDFLKANPTKKNEFKNFWFDVANILIDSFNENGTSDILHLEKVKS